MVASFHELAERELNEAAAYYQQEQSELGPAFLADVQRCADAILEYPEAGPIVRGRIRRRLCRRFPYALLYTISEGRIRILAVMNLKRRPAYWVGRS